MPKRLTKHEHAGRNALPEHLPRREEIIAAEGEERLMGKLYAVEKEAREAKPPRSSVWRCDGEEALRSLKNSKRRLPRWLCMPCHRVNLQKPAITPSASGLKVYLQDGRIEIDQNLCENAMRPLAFGRNYDKLGIMRSSGARRGLFFLGDSV